MRKEDKLKECKGCTLNIERCMILRYGNVKECPCLSCLVKVVCNEACSKFESFYTQKIHDVFRPKKTRKVNI